MRPPSLEELVPLPEEVALQRWFDGRNYLVLRPLLGILTALSFVGLMTSRPEGRLLAAIFHALSLVAILTLSLSRRGRFFAANFRQILLAFVLFELIGVALVVPRAEDGMVIAGFVFPFTLILFRLRLSEYLLLMGVALTVVATSAVVGGGEGAIGDRLAMGIAGGVWNAGALLLALRISRRRARTFLAGFRHERQRSLEQNRMRDELEDARQIQLSMLPSADPELSWAEIASVSLPASEVGGDYFDYVHLDEGRLAIVVGDVAGHGVASGLMLAAVRAGVHLLRDELAEPVAAIEKLNRMVQELAPRRMYVTLQVAVLDGVAGQVTVVSAGHPAALLVPAEGRTVSEVGSAALPLGTRLGSHPSAATAPFAPGDVLLLFTDGAVELAALTGEVYGQARLEQAARRAAALGSARQVRDDLLAGLDHFRGDQPLRDDLTLVVVRRLAR